MSRQDIAASLGAKDPSWFRQTADRGHGSAAYRKSDNDPATAPAFSGRGMRLPGMSDTAEDRPKEEREKATPPSSPSKSAYTLPTIRQQPSDAEQAKSTKPTSTLSTTWVKSPALDLPAFKPLDLITSLGAETSGLGRSPSILSTSGRPPSPTKGLGGFVESAMMKRSDSVSKRWSVQANSGLPRGDSVASTRPVHLPSISSYAPGHTRLSSRDVRGTQDGNSSPLSSSRPVSSHGEPVPITKHQPVSRPEDESAPLPEADNESCTTAEVSKASDVQQQQRPVTPPSSEALLCRSPSKTMDTRRWSPTKASWLESALNKPPESPRAAKPETPAWRISMQRAKQEQRSQPSEPATEVSTNPGIGPKPPSPPPLMNRRPLAIVGADGNGANPRSSKPDVVKTVSEPSPPQDAKCAPKGKQISTEKKDEKPSIPSKRKITPVQLGAASAKTTDNVATVSAQVHKQTVNPPSTPATPEPKMEEKPVLKPKPETPPKTDFRANLRSRQAVTAGSNDAEPEFKAVFGKLKRAQTQHYVAPDVLKDNISAGKAALNATGGPQKTKRVDELKESILQKKEAMKAGSTASSNHAEVTSPAEKQAEPVPEALARRTAMQMKGPTSEQVETIIRSVDVRAEPSISTPKPLALPEKPTPTGPITNPAVTGIKPRPAVEKPSQVKEDLLLPLGRSTISKSPASGKAERLDVAERPALLLNSASEAPVPPVQPERDTSSAEISSSTEPSSKAKLPDNSKLAARLNPALVGILSRSGSPRPSGDRPANSEGTVQVRDSPQLSRETTKEDSSELTHMTKARAKGPKRRAPKSDSTSTGPNDITAKRPLTESSPITSPKTSSSEPVPEAKTVLPSRSLTAKSTSTNPAPEVQNVGLNVVGSKSPLSTPPNAKMEKPDQVAVTRPLPTGPKAEIEKPAPAKIATVEQPSTESQSVPRAEPELKSEPMVGHKSTELRKVSSVGTPPRTTDEPPLLKPNKSADPRILSSPGPPSILAGDPASLKPTTPKRIEILPDHSASVSSPPESDGDRKGASLPPMDVSSVPLTPSKSKLNGIKAPKSDLASLIKPLSATSAKTKGLGLQLGSTSRRTAAAPILTPPPEPGIAAVKPISPKKPVLATKSASVKPQLERFFGVLPQVGETAEFNTHAFLSAQNKAGEKSKTLRKQIWEVSANGKRTPMPPQQEHILFEDSMYLCVHSMQLPSRSKSSEVYLWTGDEVPEAAIEDAQLFCRKIARENSAKLEVIKQGKESSEFFQALGGIIIVRRNKSSALYMLCGRRHLGHIAFDEVDLSLNSLCSGLPFLISAKFGKLYLWKGKGSDPEDVGCARLIGMDLGLTGEIEEISEGEEPLTFWESLSSQSGKQSTSQIGKQTEQLHGHAPRLYRVEHDRPKSSGGLGGFWGLRAASPPKQNLKALLEEVAPFTQKDLDGHHISILDLYQEIYV